MKTKRPPSNQPLPANANKVFQGEIFSIYQWPQKLYNGEEVIFEKLQRADTVSIIPITTDGKIIIEQQQQPSINPFVCIPGGVVDPGEDPHKCAIRELQEETGYTSANWELLFSLQPVAKIDYAIYYFIARDCTQNHSQNLDGGEKIKLKTVNFEEFMQIITEENFRDQTLLSYILRQHYLGKLKNFEKTILKG